ncbi:hypothetical protein U8Q06_20860 [Rhizobium beringeri]|uniref:hypothetical protein n=1 Tax=Rhizobium beringeri TaxID=3019934 RepID=UPI002E153E49|nr:hypothetical protein U8Q06_20860 [Rhizobium beringeri]
MQTDHKTNGGPGASFTRRNFFQIAAASTAAALPAVAEAATAEIPQLPLTDEQQLETCIEQLKAILKRMYPLAEDVTSGHIASRRGSGTVVVCAATPSCWWQGQGFYEVFEAGAVRVYWIDRQYSKAESRWQLWGAIERDGRLVAPRTLIDEGDLRRKLPGGVA